MALTLLSALFLRFYMITIEAKVSHKHILLQNSGNKW